MFLIVIDTGIDLHHQDIDMSGVPYKAGGLMDKYGVYGVASAEGGNVEDITMDNTTVWPMPENFLATHTYHGTYVAGLAGAAANGIGVVGMAPGITLIPVNRQYPDKEDNRPTFTQQDHAALTEYVADELIPWLKDTYSDARIIVNMSYRVSESGGDGQPSTSYAAYEKLMKMEESLRSVLVGQDEAIRKVVRAIRRNRAGIKSPGRPVGSFLFFGPTGVGKTQLAKCIAEYLFGSRENIIRIDMSEYMEKFTASRLTGAPPGYVGYEEGGQLSEKVRRQPYSVVLLDEIEKAHPDIFNLLLQVLDEGRLTDSSGRSVDFRNTILIMTSNVGSREMDEYGNGVGYVTASRDTASSRKSILEKSIRKIFPPEFINRIDEQIQFNPLGKADIEKIIDIEIKDLRRRVSEAGYRLNITPSAKRLVAERGYDPRFGARPLKRAIQRYIEDPVSEYIISCRSGSASATGEAVTIKVGTSPDRQDTLIIPGRKLQSLDIDEFKTEVTDDAGKGA